MPLPLPTPSQPVYTAPSTRISPHYLLSSRYLTPRTLLKTQSSAFPRPLKNKAVYSCLPLVGIALVVAKIITSRELTGF